MPQKILDFAIDVYKLHKQFSDVFPFLLESVAENAKIGRYDILFYRPQIKIVQKTLQEDDFLHKFDYQWKKFCTDEDKTIAPEIPFRGGWFVFFAYELTQQIESKLSLINPPYPIAYAAKCGAAIVVDKIASRTYFIADLSAVDAIVDMQTYVNKLTINKYTKQLSVLVCEDEEKLFIDGVEKSRRYITAGDVFQVNLSRQWSFDLLSTDINLLYDNLRKSNPSPFAASCHLSYGGGEVSILSSSPERLISIRSGQIATRPIAGTRLRHRKKDKDSAMILELIEHLKERAEHIMLIDLERNDLGKICQPGSIKVDEFMKIESYAYVHHIVSNITGQIRNDISPADAIRAMFPGGTITGCPKLRCMEIIGELENTYRGAYTGSLGYINHNGDMDSNILIRTFVCYNNRAEFRAGAGIVYDSIAKHELKETRNKAMGLLQAL